MSDVFVSYKAEDRRRVKPLVEALQAEGFSVWWDEQIGGGAAWRSAIEAELNAAKCVIVIWSTRSVGPDGTFVQDEATRAQQRHVYVPVLIDKVHLPLGFGETQALPLTGWRGNRSDPRYEAVLSAVRRNVGGKRRGAASPAPQAGVDRRTAIAGGAIATLAVAGVGAWALLKPGWVGAASGSIAVLPFENLSGDPGQAYFSDGVAEEIRNALARIAGLKVVGRTSSEAVRNDDAETAAKKLAVANILTGSVRQSASTIRVSAQLVDGRNGIDRWSQDYDRAPGDAIKIQTDIAENVASALTAALAGASRAAIQVAATQNPEAQRLFLQAKALNDGPPNKPILQQGLRLLDSAIALDPSYADAYALKSQLLSTMGNSYASGAEALAKYRSQALSAVQNALRLDPNLPDAHEALATVYSSTLRMGPAYSEHKRARQLAPGDVEILTSLAVFTSKVIDPNDALRLLDQAIAMDPLNGYPLNMRVASLYDARRYEDVVSAGKQLQRSGRFGTATTVGDALVELGRFKDAQSYYDKEQPDFWWRLLGEAVLACRSGNRAGAEAKLATLQKSYGDAASYQYGEIYAQLGDKDRAFDWLEHGFSVKDAGLTKMRVDPLLDPLRSDPRFTALLRKMNFPGA